MSGEDVGAWTLLAGLLAWLTRSVGKQLSDIVTELRAIRTLLDRSEGRELAELASDQGVVESVADVATGPVGKRKGPRAKTSTVVDLAGRPFEGTGANTK